MINRWVKIMIGLSLILICIAIWQGLTYLHYDKIKVREREFDRIAWSKTIGDLEHCPVVVARRNVNEGHIFEPADLGEKLVPLNELRHDTFGSAKYLIGRKCTFEIPEGCEVSMFAVVNGTDNPHSYESMWMEAGADARQREPVLTKPTE
jgi:hypothetical protein